MHRPLTFLLDQLDRGMFDGTDVLAWGAPVPVFGDIDSARLVTLGINPSSREFVDETGRELADAARRFPTLHSLGLHRWADADFTHIRSIERACRAYFTGNPYDGWFRRLDQVISGTSSPFYAPMFPACHLDLVPYATSRRWGTLSRADRDRLLEVGMQILGELLAESPARVLILNGKTVVEQFQRAAGIKLEPREMAEWELPRSEGPPVRGIAYEGWAFEVAGRPLGRGVRLLGYNHNIQSSFGVTTEVIRSIRAWIAQEACNLLP